MSLSLVSADHSGFGQLGANELDKLQLEQFQHDETYHREIARLPVQRRLTHMSLHFAKYAGYLAEGGDDVRSQQVATDVFVIVLSSANILNLQLSAVIDLQTELGASDEAGFARNVCVAAGKMSAACEKLDHLEDFPFRATLRDGVLALARAVISYCSAKNWKLVELVTARRASIRSKSSFLHG